MVRRTKAQRRADTDSLSMVWPKAGRDQITCPLRHAYATPATVPFEKEGTFEKCRFEPKTKVHFKRYGRD